jgi:hypothetical protein
MSSKAQHEKQLADAERPPQRDAQPDPEPAVPSLPQPDPGVFHHDPSDVAVKASSKDNHA